MPCRKLCMQRMEWKRTESTRDFARHKWIINFMWQKIISCRDQFAGRSFAVVVVLYWTNNKLSKDWNKSRTSQPAYAAASHVLHTLIHILIFFVVYLLLQVEQIQAEYKVLALQFHPDKNNGDKDAEAKFQSLKVFFYFIFWPHICYATFPIKLNYVFGRKH